MKRLTGFILTAIVCISLSAKSPKYIFLMFGDGMSLNTIAMTENYRSYLKGDPLGFDHLTFRDFPCVGLTDNHCSVAMVSGSAEAATALFGGVKSINGAIGVDPDGKPVEVIFSNLHKRGFKVGIMSTDPINHATPAVTYAHSANRGDYREITRQLPASGFDFFAGNSFIDFDDVEKGLNADQYTAKHGYTTYYGREEFAARDRSAGTKPILVHERCRREKSNITAEVDRNKNYTLQDDGNDLTPAEMLDFCLESFGDESPFIILLEEGNIDHAAHLNFPMAVANEILKLDAAVVRALKFYEQHPDETLIVVFTDHETGGLSLCKHHNGEIIDWKHLIDDWNSGRPRDTYRKDECRKLSSRCNLHWSTGNHTGAPTAVFSIGAGAERFSGCYDNTLFGRKILELVNENSQPQ